MTLSQQVCSLDLAKRLKELGVKQESLYWWSDENRTGYVGGTRCEMKLVYAPNIKMRNVDFSAFTVAELGELLKETQSKIDCGDTVYCHSLENEKPTIGWSGGLHEVSADTEADARAKMLIYLLENKLVTI